MGFWEKLTGQKFKIPDDEYADLLHRYTRDLTQLDKAGKFDPVTGRDDEMDKMLLILLQRLRKNVLLLGGAGVGKTALFVGLAQYINHNRVPAMLAGATVIEIEMSMIGAGSSERSILDGRLIPIIRGAAERNATRACPPIIFCIDEFHQLSVAFKNSASAGVADMMKPYLTMGELYIVAATTREEYEDYVRLDPAVDRRFQKIYLEQPDVALSIFIVKNMKKNFEDYYNITIPDQHVERICRLTERFIRNRNNPDKAILALDQACARCVKDGDAKVLDIVSVNRAVAADAGIDPAAIEGY
ncbi:MAG: ATP-dependent Clp protease ATP-binding subunit [Alphaproteobacteria bacterium]|nr:ATP-dependent Clp protease ATP-binding subunit [Alphaproteobacteria bacterium]